ncbi:MAG TPA: hypothetical protein PLL58_02945 [Candidatus Syntrophosphaera sp.]|mgnify:CR=1 FL=1|jgi:hypothetical protein|nr:hypothetical protein [Candidatus Syntrophosphaera sp.]
MQNRFQQHISLFTVCVVVLIGMSLLQTSLAEEMQSIQQLKQHTQERWVQTYRAHGREISVDVLPFVPEVDEFPIIKAIFDLSVPNTTKLEKGWHSYVREDGHFSISSGEYSQEKDSIRTHTTTTEYFPPFDLDRTYAQYHTLTLRERISYLQSIMQATNHGEWYLKQPIRISVNLTTTEKEGEAQEPESFYFNFVPALKGIPIFCHVNRGIESPRDTAIDHFPYLSLRIGPSEFIDIGGVRLNPVEVLAKDVPLMSFSAIQNSIEREIHAGYIRKIFDVQLGYALYNEPGSSRKPGYEWMRTAQFYALPVWVVHCHYVNNPAQDLRDYKGRDVPERSVIEYKTLIVNAQTGVVMDREDNRIEAADYPGFVSWENMGGKP